MSDSTRGGTRLVRLVRGRAGCLVDEAEVCPCSEDEPGGRLGLLERPGEQCARRVVDQRAHVRGDLRPGAAQPRGGASRHENVLGFADASPPLSY